MSIRALITEGVGPGGSIKYLITGGLDIGAALLAKSPPWPPPIVTQTYRLRSLTARFDAGVSNITSLTGRYGSHWEFDVGFVILDDTRTRAWRAFLAMCQDKALTFYWSPYPKGRPKNFQAGTGWGSPLVNGSWQNGKTLSVKGMTVGAAFVAGDFIAFDNPLFRELHMITASATVDGSGNATFTITPEIHRAPADGATVYFDGHAVSASSRCACEVMVADGGQAAYTLSGFQSDFSFKLIESIK